MDPRAFDELAKQLSRKTSRGQALKMFGGALVGTLVGARTALANPPQKHCKFEGYGCGDNTDCCSQLCCNRTCCGPGQMCSSGMCVGGTSPPPPPPPGGCTTPADCPQAAMGSCQTAACTAGTCGFVPDNANLPTTCSECQVPTCNPMGQPACVNKPTGTACSNGICNGMGQCGCPTGTTNCGGVCVNTNSDVTNCGGCGVFCSTPPNSTPTCSNGACGFNCNAGFVQCGGTCVNLSTDPNNCGSCGHVCSFGMCTNGVCFL
jgi:hypothetical protein